MPMLGRPCTPKVSRSTVRLDRGRTRCLATEACATSHSRAGASSCRQYSTPRGAYPATTPPGRATTVDRANPRGKLHRQPLGKFIVELVLRGGSDPERRDRPGRSWLASTTWTWPGTTPGWDGSPALRQRKAGGGGWAHQRRRGRPPRGEIVETVHPILIHYLVVGRGAGIRSEERWHRSRRRAEKTGGRGPGGSARPARCWRWSSATPGRKP